MIVIHDDFSGLLGVTKGMFPNSDIQLCTVHMLRNAKTHLSKEDASEFTRGSVPSKPLGAPKSPLLNSRSFVTVRKILPAFVKEIRKKRPTTSRSLKYPDAVRRSLSTTNAVEAINKQLEILRRNSGGYFHSEETAKLKLGIVVTSLESGKCTASPLPSGPRSTSSTPCLRQDSRRNDARDTTFLTSAARSW